MRPTGNIITDTIDRFNLLWKQNKESIKRQLLVTAVICLISAFLICGGNAGTIILFLFLYIPLNGLLINIRRLSEKDYVTDTERNYEVSTKGTHGTARFLTDEEVEEKFHCGKLEDCTEMIFGTKRDDEKKVVTPIVRWFAENLNTCIVGMPGCGKSRCLILNMLFQIFRRGESVIATDTKGDLARKTYKVAQKKRYVTKIINFKVSEIQYSDSINIMKFIGGSLNKAETLAKIIISNTTKDDRQDFWYDTGVQLLQTLILYVNFSKDIKDKSLAYIYDILTKQSVTQIEQMLGCIDERHPAYKPFNLFKGATQTIKESTRFGLGVKLNMFNNPIIRKITSVDDVDLKLPADEKCAYFFIMDDQDSTYQPLMAIVVALLYMELIGYADSLPTQELPKKVNFVGDEFCNIGNIPDFVDKMASVRSRGLVTSLVVQDLGQFERKYPDNQWSSIMSSCEYKILIKTDDEITAEYFSKRTGEQTAHKVDISHGANKLDIVKYHTDYNERESTQERMLMTQHEIRTMSPDEMLLCKTGENVTLIKKMDYTKHPFSKHIEMFNPNQNKPLWWRGDAMPAGLFYDPELMSSSTPAGSSAQSSTSGAASRPANSVWASFQVKPQPVSTIYDRNKKGKSNDKEVLQQTISDLYNGNS